MSFSGLERRPLLVALIAYWIAIGVAALTLAFAVRRDATTECGTYLPYLAVLTPGNSSVTLTDAV
jgi:hypothetical protein